MTNTRQTHIKHTYRWILVPLLTLLVLFLVSGVPTSSVSAASQAITSNPYSVNYGPPDCTWYAWQRLHDVEGIDFQFAPAAAGWLTDAPKTNAFWSERTQSYIQVQLNLTPVAGDIMVLPVPSKYAYPAHVAFVEAELDGNGNFQVSEQNSGDTSPGYNTSPYPWVSHHPQNLQDTQAAEGGQARFIHFSGTNFTPQTLDSAVSLNQSGNLTVQRNQQFSISFTEQNTGNTTWSDSGGYALTCLLNCIGASNIGFGGQSVAPGQQWKFTTTLTAPSTIGASVTSWVLEHNNIQFGDTSLFVTVAVHILPGGEWISPTNGSAVNTIMHFAAHAYPTKPGDPPIDHVNFTLMWPGASSWKIACTVSSPTSTDIYACDVNLDQLGVPVGQFQVSFDVYDRAGNVNQAPNGEHTLTYSPGLSTSQAISLATTYYNTKGVWAGTYVLKQVDTMLFGQPDGNELLTCIAYEYANPSTPNVTAGTDRRTFSFQHTGSGWQVIAMGDYMSCSGNSSASLLDAKQAANLVIPYYDTKGVWAGTYVLRRVDTLSFSPQNGNEVEACVAYEYANPSTPGVTAGTDRRTFLFVYSNNSWQVISMGDYMSC